MKTKIMATMMVIGISVIFAQMGYTFELDKATMDTALREELSKIDDVALRQAMLDEYKDILRQNMPELNIDEATCQSCEEDIKELEKEQLAALNKETANSAQFSAGTEKLLEKQKIYKTVTEMRDQTTMITQKKWVDAAGNDKPADVCPCEGGYTQVSVQVPVTTQVAVTTTVETGETVQ